MKPLALVVPFLIFCFSCQFAAGQNLVPNPSFEEHTDCPEGFPDLDGTCNNWISFRGTPDYFNNCSGVCGYSNNRGFQQPHTGQAYAGISTFQKTTQDSREHLAIELTEPLVVNQKYYFSFFVSSGYTPLLVNIATNKIGANVSEEEYSDPDETSSLPNSSKVFSEEIIEDTANWVKISGSFVADSEYRYLILGSFFDDGHIDTSYFPYQVVPQVAYYFVDDVCLSTDSLYSQTWTLSVDEEQEPDILIYPNPASNGLYLKSSYLLESIEVINILGETVSGLTMIQNR